VTIFLMLNMMETFDRVILAQLLHNIRERRIPV
jgi:hypothetical protein